MSTDALSLLLLSALMHALWNLLVKQSRDKTAFIWWMFTCALLLMQPLAWWWPAPMAPLTLKVVLLAMAGSGCFALYHLLNGMAYRHNADLSMIYPLSQTSMLWVPLWGVLFLHEPLSLTGLLGIALVILGAYGVQLQHVRLGALGTPLTQWRNPSVVTALAAGLIYSFGALSDKAGVRHYAPFYFTYLLVLFMWIFLSFNLLRSGFPCRLRQEWHNSGRWIALAGPVLMGSFLPFRFGLQLAPVSYAVQIRQASLLVGVLIGVFFLKESCGPIRLVSAALIVAGIVAIRFG